MNNITDLRDIVLYQNETGDKKIEVLYDNEDFWLTQKTMSDLFSVKVNTINYHLKEIFNSKELDENSTIRKIRIVQKEGNRKVNREIEFYSLDAIIAVGYRVNSYEETQFRIWATNTLKEYIKKGFIVNTEMLKNGPKFGKDYLDELLLKIKEIRASERRFYQKITDIYASCSIDYDKDSEITKKFFKTVQNKLHYAVTGNTAAEIIYSRANSEKMYMGLTNWKNSPNGPIYKYDVDIAKNYLDEKELKDLNRIVTMYLDYAEMQAENHNAMTMNEWVEKLNAFLQFNGKEILHNAGKISQKVAEELAYSEYEKFKLKQDKSIISDFDKFLNKSMLLENKINNSKEGDL